MRILLAEDDENLNKSLTKRLVARGFDVDSCSDGDEALYYAEQNIHDVILLDRMLPHMDGTKVLQKLRAENIAVPVIIITALGALGDKVTGLNLGADDYLVKPFEFEELIARIQCCTRRSLTINMTNALELADISYNADSNVLSCNGESCSLSNREGALLEVFLRSPNQTIPRGTLLLKVWGSDSDVEDGNLDNYIHFLQRRLKNVGSSLELRTVRGIGYFLEARTT